MLSASRCSHQTFATNVSFSRPDRARASNAPPLLQTISGSLFHRAVASLGRSPFGTSIGLEEIDPCDHMKCCKMLDGLA
eukprot:scaffold2563_cov124-Cylindrotheca_fusiformis.AAC.23